MQKNSKIFIAVILAVLIMGHSFTSYAADGGSNGQIISTYYSIPSDSSIVALNSTNIFRAYSGDISAISGSNPWRMGASSWSDSTFHDILNNRLRFSAVEWAGTVYDTSTYSFAITPINDTNTNGFIYMMFGSDTPVVFVDGFAVSQSPIIYVCGYYQFSDNTLLSFDPWSPIVSVIDTASDNGFYCVSFKRGNDYPCPNFTTMPVYISSSDGGTGFETFSTTSTDFSFDNLDSYHNFNIQMTNELFTDPNAPAPSPDSPMNELVDQNTYANLSSYISGYDIGNCALHLNFGLPSFMRQHPEYYKVVCTVEATIRNSNSFLNDTYGKTYEIPMTAIIGYGGRVPVSGSSGTSGNFMQLINWSDLVNSNDDTLTLDLRDYWKVKSGCNDNTIADNTWSESIFEILSSGLPVGVQDQNIYYGLKAGYDITSFNMYADIQIVANTGQQSGTYSTMFNLLEGSQSILQNDISIRTNPVTGEPEYIVVEKEVSSSPSYGGPVAYGYGGSVGNITINSGEQYKYTISAGSVEAYNGMIDDIKEEMAGLSENNFFQIMGRTLGFIPDAFWYYLAIGSGVIVFSAIVRFVLRR